MGNINIADILSRLEDKIIYLLNGGIIWNLPTPDSTKWNKIVYYFLINQIIAG